MVDPARLARGLRAACLRLGVRIHENTPVHRAGRPVPASVLRTAYGRVTARRVALGTNAFPPLLRRMSAYVVPGLGLRADDRAADRRAARGRSAGRTGTGSADAGNLFHYYRVTDDWRILWGGYDAVYHFGGRTDDRLERNPETFLPAGRALLRHLPAAGGAAVHPRLGRRHRHLLAVLRVLGHARTAAGWPTPRLHRPRRRRDPVRRRRCCSTCSRARDTERTALEMVPAQAGAVPARAAALGRRRADPARRSPRRTRSGGRRGPWLRTLDRSAWASTHDGPRPTCLRERKLD